jgi:perosamine synthetase
MISYGKQSIEQDDIDVVVKVLKGDWLTQGPDVKLFENDLQRYFGAGYSCVVSNGTAALHLTGIALGWQPGDIIITTPITFLATANCIVYAGATPDFVDIDLISYTIDSNQVAEKVKAHQSKGRNVKAVIGVDYAGHPCDWKSLREIADKYNLQLVNDNCHALGSSYFDDKKYAIKYADAVTQSYHPVKHFTTGEGGAILTNDQEVDEKVRRLRNHGMTKAKDQLEDNDAPWYYEINEVGYNYRITDFQCALGVSQLKKLDRFINIRRNLAKKYDKAFSNINFLKIPEPRKSVEHSYHLYPLQIDFKNLSITKSEFFKKMKESGISLQVHYIPVHLQPFYRKNYGFKAGDFPVSESFYSDVISLPIYPNLSIGDISFIVNNILEILSE